MLHSRARWLALRRERREGENDGTERSVDSESEQAAEAAKNGTRNMSRKCTTRARASITEEMAFSLPRSAKKSNPKLVRSEIARGRAIIPANIQSS
jgi:thiamine biosynthesis protein ThiC